jgi:hypothetical protein
MIIVRFADDIVLGFQEKSDAEQFRGTHRENAEFNLELHPEIRGGVVSNHDLYSDYQLSRFKM